jgi:hypothetical protein
MLSVHDFPDAMYCLRRLDKVRDSGWKLRQLVPGRNFPLDGRTAMPVMSSRLRDLFSLGPMLDVSSGFPSLGPYIRSMYRRLSCLNVLARCIRYL